MADVAKEFLLLYQCHQNHNWAGAFTTHSFSSSLTGNMLNLHIVPTYPRPITFQFLPYKGSDPNFSSAVEQRIQFNLIPRSFNSSLGGRTWFPESNQTPQKGVRQVSDLLGYEDTDDGANKCPFLKRLDEDSNSAMNCCIFLWLGNIHP